ncbi:MAG: hypothetical protein AB7I30_14240, partial [Isosphaeraceae bacterium]
MRPWLTSRSPFRRPARSSSTRLPRRFVPLAESCESRLLLSEFRVNSYTTGSQIRSQTATTADGGFVIAWTSQGQDGSGNGVYALRFDALGAPVGSEFRVYSHTDGDQFLQAVA